MLGGIGNFLQETRQELKKVSWPNREELLGSTGVVLFTTFILAIFIGCIDFVLSQIMRFLIR